MMPPPTRRRVRRRPPTWSELSPKAADLGSEFVSELADVGVDAREPDVHSVHEIVEPRVSPGCALRPPQGNAATLTIVTDPEQRRHSFSATKNLAALSPEPAR